MDSRQLELFVQVAGSGSLSRAAIQTGVTQPRLTRIIKELEVEVGAALFYRTGRGVMLTDTGSRLLARSQKILRSIYDAKNEAIASGGATVSNATIAFPPSIAKVFSGPLAQLLSSKFPGIKLRFAEAFSCYLLEWLSNGTIEIAVLYKSRPAQQFHFEPLLCEQLYVVASTDKPKLPRVMPLASISDLTLVMPGTPHGLRLLMETVAGEHGVDLSVSTEADGLGILIDLVSKGLGYTILPFASVRPEIESGLLQASPIVSPSVVRTMVLATAVNRPLTAGTQQIIAEIKSLVDTMGKETGWTKVRQFEEAPLMMSAST